MVQYYTLREAAEKLGMEPEKLKEMAKNNQLRAFQDRGTLRFRAPEIEELARSLGLGSGPELQLGELPPKSASKPPSSGKSPPPSSGKSPPPSSRRTMHVPADADLSLVGDDAVPIGEDPAGHHTKPPSDKRKPGGPAGAGGGARKSGMKGPPSPVPSHDSDVRLVSDGGGLDFPLEGGEAGNVAPAKEPPAGPKTPQDQKKRPSQLGPEENPDSGVRIVPLDQAGDSDVRIEQDDRPDNDPNVALGGMKAKTPSDSDVRLELTDPPGRRRGSQEPFVTEEIELDLEAMKQEEAKTKRRRPSKSTPELPTTSPFELSEEDAAEKPPKSPKGGKKPGKKDTDSSSDFELTPADPADLSPIELGSDELPIPLAKDDEEVGLDEAGGPGAHASGINLRDPRDSGISLEEGGSEEMEFGRSADAGSTPKPGPRTPKPVPGGKDSSGEFELSMDDSPVGEDGNTSSEFELSLDPGTGEEDSSSEFELSLDPNATNESPSASKLEEDSSTVDSDSEFELSLDASGELEASKEAGLTDDKDIFETDFEVPALEDESGSEAVALDESDTDLEDSDFELDLSDEDLAAESGSQVVALEEGAEAAGEVELDEEAPSRKPRSKKAAAASEEFDEPLIDLDEMEDEAAVEADEEAAPAPAAPWGVVPALFLVPSFVVMFFVVILSFELLQSAWGYHTGGYGARLLIDPLARQIDKNVP